MVKTVIVGAGRIGGAIAQLLHACGDYDVMVVDGAPSQLAALEGCEGVDRRVVDVDQPLALAAALRGAFAVVNAAPFHLTLPVAEAAAGAKVHYFDLTEDVASTRLVAELARDAERVFVPQCGLAPGYVGIAAAALARRFDVLHDVRLRVGALPQFPTGALGYNLTWSTDGVINEYIQPCEAIVDGRRCETPPLEACETFALDGVAYEAFNTSGGLGGLCTTFEGRVRNLNYRTIRYPGHAATMKVLLNELGLRRRRAVLKDVLEGGLATTAQDVVIVLVSVTGLRGGRFVQETDVRKIYAGTVGGVARSAIQITTASGVAAVVDLLAAGRLRRQGLLLQDEIDHDLFLANRFGRAFVDGAAALDRLAPAADTAGAPPSSRAVA